MEIERRAKSIPSGTSYFLGLEEERQKEREQSRSKIRMAECPVAKPAEVLQNEKKVNHREMEGKKLPFDDAYMIITYNMRNLYDGGVGDITGVKG